MEKKFDYAKAIAELEEIARKVENPETGAMEDLYNYGMSYKDSAGNTITRMATANSIVMNAMGELDQLVHRIATDINNVLTGEKKQIDAGETPSYAAGEPLPLDLLTPVLISEFLTCTCPSPLSVASAAQL